MLITITEAAAAQILAGQSPDTQEMGLRIAAKRRADGSIDYIIGFDDPRPDDATIANHEVKVLIAPTSVDLLDGTTLDYVELDSGIKDFIFLNPNDPHYAPPKRGKRRT